MPCDELPDDLKTLWKEVGANPPTFSPDQLRREANRLQAKRRRGQILVVAVMLFLAASYAFSFFGFPNTLARLGGALTIIACGYWLVHALRERARPAPDPGETDGLSFYRAELEHARDNHRWMSWRFLLVAGPFILFDIGAAQLYAKFSPFIVWLMCFDCALLLVVLAVWAPAKNLKMARKYQGRVDALDSMMRSAETRPKP
jgi:NADH:ubiquinone oxidoreductase subunit 3 (subunit A)